MPKAILCKDCGETFLTSLPKCPHCGRPSRFPNVDFGQEGGAELARRYQSALDDAKLRGAEGQVQAFDAYVKDTHLVMNRSLAFVLELAEEKGAYSTFYQRRDAGMIFPDGDAWDRWREAADALLFGAAKEEIRFAALTTQGRGMTSYGECTLIPGDKFVTHRVSFTEENTAQRLKSKGLRAGGAALFRPDELADWATRHLLSTAKAAPQVTTSTTTADFPALVLKPGATTDDDQFVEGHIYGPLTLRSFISCSLPSQSSRFRKSVIKGLAQKLQKLNIAVPSP